MNSGSCAYAERTLDVRLTFGVQLPDVKEAYAIEIRRGVAQFHEGLPAKVDILLEIDRSTLEGILLGEIDIAGKTGSHPYTPLVGLFASIESGRARLVDGTADDFKQFLSYFDPPSKDRIPLTVR